jgi:hypothetical protein
VQGKEHKSKVEQASFRIIDQIIRNLLKDFYNLYICMGKEKIPKKSGYD